MTLTETRRLLAEFGVRPNQALGQNFLIDSNILAIILREGDVQPDEVVLEIGPGLGVLTAALAERAREVIAIEKDRRLAACIRQRLPGVTLIEGDAVEILGRAGARPAATGDPTAGAAPAAPWRAAHKVVANLPYRVSTAVLERLVEGEPRPRRMVVTLQREVAERLRARPGSKEYGALTVFTQLAYHVTIAHLVSSRCFYPAPRVESAVVVLDRREPRVAVQAGAPFHDLVRRGFGQRRKMLRNLLGAGQGTEPAWQAAAIAPTARAEQLSVEQWVRLANAWRE